MAPPLNQEWLPRIRANFEKKTMEELAAIYVAHDDSEWSPEAFQVIRDLFEERGRPLPQIRPKLPDEANGPKPIRARTFQGCGTKFIGQRDFQSDGSHVTTHWFVLFNLPIFPLRSLRVRYLGPDKGRGFGYSPKDTFAFLRQDKFEVREVTRPNAKQVCCVYGFTLLLVAWFFVCLSLTSAHHGSVDKMGYLFFGGLVPLFLIPVGLRYFAKRRAGI